MLVRTHDYCDSPLFSVSSISAHDGARHSCRLPPPRIPAPMTLSSAETLVGHRAPPSPSSVRVSCQVAVSYNRIASRSPATTANLLPSDKNAAPQTASKKPRNVVTSFQVVASHT